MEAIKEIQKEVRSRQILAMIVYALIQMTSLITPYLMGVIIDDYIPNQDIFHIIVGIALFVAIPMMTILLQTIYQYFKFVYLRKKGNEIALRVMKNLVYQKKNFFDQQNSMELLSYCSKEATGYLQFYVSEMSQFYVNIFVAVVVFLVLLWMNQQIALLQLLYYPIAYLPTRFIMKNIDKIIQRILSLNAELNQIKGDIFQAIELVKLARLEEKKLDEVNEKNEAVNAIWGRVAALDSLTGAWSNAFTSVLFKGITFGIGALLIISFGQNLQVGQLVSIITYAGIFYASVNSVIMTKVMDQKKTGEYEKLFSFLELSGEKEEEEKKAPFSLQEEIRFTDCCFRYDSQEDWVLQHMNLRFKAGSWTGIVGPSGQGKSTVLDIILKLYPVEDGSVFIDDVDINRINAFSIRDHITKIAQDVFLFPGTIEENLKLMREGITEEEIWEALRFACLDDYVRELPQGIKTDVGEAGKLMSGGERQRLSIAMGLLRGNKILLLDEITSNLDLSLEERLADHFQELVQNGYTIISISHRLSFLKYAQDVYEMREGKAQLQRDMP